MIDRGEQHRWLLAGLLFITPAGAAWAGDPTPEAGAKAFYEVYLKTKVSGIPDTKERPHFQPVISPSLYQLLTTASQAETEHSRKTGGEAPPLVEGDMFTSLFEGAATYSVASCDAPAANTTCTIDLTAPGDDGATTRWQDKLVLTRGKGSWQVDDVQYGGSWDFGPHGTLRASLAAMISDEKEE